MNTSDVAASCNAIHEAPPKSFGSRSSGLSYSGGIHRHETLKDFARWIADELKQREGTYDFVAVTGQSGMSVAFAALMLRDFPLIVVRKGESTHGEMIEGRAETMGRYIVVDDFICSGQTMRNINRELKKWAKRDGSAPPEHVGSLLYRDKRYDDRTY